MLDRRKFLDRLCTFMPKDCAWRPTFLFHQAEKCTAYNRFTAYVSGSPPPEAYPPHTWQPGNLPSPVSNCSSVEHQITVDGQGHQRHIGSVLEWSVIFCYFGIPTDSCQDINAKRTALYCEPARGHCQLNVMSLVCQ